MYSFLIYVIVFGIIRHLHMDTYLKICNPLIQSVRIDYISWEGLKLQACNYILSLIYDFIYYFKATYSKMHN